MTISKAPQAFPRTEYMRRLAVVKSEMARRKVEALVVSNSSNQNYLTGYTARSGYVPQALVVSMDQEEPTFLMREMDAPAALHQTFLEHGKVIGYPESLVGNPNKDGYDAIIDFLHESGLANRAVGLERGVLSAPAVEKFNTRLLDATLVDCTSAVNWIRMVKSELEISVLKEAAAITDAAVARAAEIFRAGVREADAIAEIVSTLARGANGKPGTWIATPYCAPRHERERATSRGAMMSSARARRSIWKSPVSVMAILPRSAGRSPSANLPTGYAAYMRLRPRGWKLRWLQSARDAPVVRSPRQPIERSRSSGSRKSPVLAILSGSIGRSRPPASRLATRLF